MTTTQKITPLRGHVSAETAYVVNDYPYGFRLRCRIRYWLEEKKGHGTRLVSQTTNPKQGNDWTNKPKASTYSTGLAFLYLNADGHVAWVTQGVNEAHRFADIRAQFDLNEEENKTLDLLEKISRKLQPTTWAKLDGIAAFKAGTPREANPVDPAAPAGVWGKPGEPLAAWFEGWDAAAHLAAAATVYP